MNNVNYEWPLNAVVNTPYCFYSGIFTDEEIDNIIKIGNAEDIINAEVEGKNDGVRNTKISWVPSNKPQNVWLFQKLTDIIHSANNRYFNFDIDAIENLQYSLYNEGYFYKNHTDMLVNAPRYKVRKLSFSLQLTDEDEYDGGDLTFLDNTKLQPPKSKGTIVLFPSYTLHNVSMVTRGTRKVLVGWVIGPSFK